MSDAYPGAADEFDQYLEGALKDPAFARAYARAQRRSEFASPGKLCIDGLKCRRRSRRRRGR